MTARVTHKRGNTLRWVCRRTTDPDPGSGIPPVFMEVTGGVTITAALRNDVIGFYQPLNILLDTDPDAPSSEGYFVVYFPGQDQAHWPLGDVFFDFVITSPSATDGQPDDVDQSETAILHIQKEETLWP
jgi:hypothetical protein